MLFLRNEYFGQDYKKKRLVYLKFVFYPSTEWDGKDPYCLHFVSVLNFCFVINSTIMQIVDPVVLFFFQIDQIKKMFSYQN